MASLTVTLPDGSRREFSQPVTGAELAAAIGPGLAKAAVAIKLDGVNINGVDDLIRALDRDRIDRTLEMHVLRMGRLRTIDIHPIERKPSARQGSAP